jgi:sugar lactone lactonase YvrE
LGYTVETVVQADNRCGEGPIWDAASGRGPQPQCFAAGVPRLLWTDNASDIAYQFVPATGEKTVISRGLPVSAIAINHTGELVFGGAAGLHLWRGQNDYRTIVSEHDGKPLAINDMIADPQGRVYAGTCYWTNERMIRHGRLYLVRGSGAVEVVDEGIELSNGLGFSPDNRVLYFTDSTARRIYAFDVHADTGLLSRKRVFAQVPGDEGIPDGLTVDAEGFVWSAQWYGSQVVRYDPDGAVERRLPMPVQQVSSVAFGDPDLTDLYITTAAVPWEGPYAPPGYDFKASNIGGSLYRVRLEIRGRAEYLACFTW